MVIAFVNATRKWGGVKTWCLDMGAALVALGHEVHIFGRGGDFVRKAAAMGLTARSVWFGFVYNPLAILYFLYCLRRHKVDVVVGNVAKDMRTAGVAARILGIPVVQHVGSGGDFPESTSTRLALTLLRPRHVCCSEYVRQAIRQYVPSLSCHEVHALHPGTAVPPTPLFEAHEPPVVVATSQLNPDKGHADLLEALARLKTEGLAFRALIAGTGRLEGQLKAQACELGLAELVEWTGFTTDVCGVLRRGDIFVLPTYIEPLGIALQEAMAAGLAPVARESGGVPEIWPPACRQFLVPPQPGPEGLHTALHTLLTMPREELLELRHAAWNHARKSFEISAQAARFAAWLEQG